MDFSVKTIIMHDVVGSVFNIEVIHSGFAGARNTCYSFRNGKKWLKLKKNVAIGDVVLIMDINLRNLWALGRVQAVSTDTKGLVRIVEVKTASNVLHRPIHKIKFFDQVKY